MTENSLPAAIADFIEATNRGDADAFVAAFTPDAYLNDWGRQFHGHDGVRDWNRTTTSASDRISSSSAPSRAARPTATSSP